MSSSTCQVLGLFLNGHEFEPSQGHWRLTRSLTSRPVRLIKVRASSDIHINLKRKNRYINSLQFYVFFFLVISSFSQSITRGGRWFALHYLSSPILYFITIDWCCDIKKIRDKNQLFIICWKLQISQFPW
jgi:hypothetical protein